VRKLISGEMLFDGKPLTLSAPSELALDIAMVFPADSGYRQSHNAACVQFQAPSATASKVGLVACRAAHHGFIWTRDVPSRLVSA
jgi:hypothetical protein